MELKININDQVIQNLVNATTANSKSQIAQDIFVLNELDFKSNGFFVDFGATDGLELSNTYLLEKFFSWQGIVAEPDKYWHKSLDNNRNCAKDFRCVWKESGQILTFNQSKIHVLSTINGFGENGLNSKTRNEEIEQFQVNTVSLRDLLIEHKAPKVIDYLSIDTEGSEFEILNAFDFNEYDIKIITCEHNFAQIREKIFHLLSSFGYKRVFIDISYVDDWYVKI